MRSTSMWLRGASYLALGIIGALWTLLARGTLFAAPEAPLRLPQPWRPLLGVALTLALAWLTLRGTRVAVERTRWGAQLHLHLRSKLLGLSAPQMVLLAGLSAWSEELLFRAALGSSIGFLGSSLLFGLVHYTPTDSYLQRVLWTGGMGLCLSALYLASGTLLAPIAAHWLINYENMQYICNYDPTPLDIDRD
jgi:uncharacterized protein